MSSVLDEARHREVLRQHLEILKELQKKLQAEHSAQEAERLQALGILSMPTMHPPSAAATRRAPTASRPTASRPTATPRTATLCLKTRSRQASTADRQSTTSGKSTSSTCGS
jgi:hypothetical protein